MAKGDEAVQGGRMELILWRHAEAEDGVPDGARALTARGRKQAKKMARWLNKRLSGDARILASPAVRAQQTAEALGVPFRTLQRIGPAASAAQLLEATGWPKAGGAVLLVGHQPSLGQVAGLLLGAADLDLQVKKGAVWWFRQCAPGSDAADLVEVHSAVV